MLKQQPSPPAATRGGPVGMHTWRWVLLLCTHAALDTRADTRFTLEHAGLPAASRVAHQYEWPGKTPGPSEAAVGHEVSLANTGVSLPGTAADSPDSGLPDFRLPAPAGALHDTASSSLFACCGFASTPESPGSYNTTTVSCWSEPRPCGSADLRSSDSSSSSSTRTALGWSPGVQPWWGGPHAVSQHRAAPHLAAQSPRALLEGASQIMLASLPIRHPFRHLWFRHLTTIPVATMSRLLASRPGTTLHLVTGNDSCCRADSEPGRCPRDPALLPAAAVVWTPRIILAPRSLLAPNLVPLYNWHSTWTWSSCLRHDT